MLLRFQFILNKQFTYKWKYSHEGNTLVKKTKKVVHMLVKVKHYSIIQVKHYYLCNQTDVSLFYYF